MSDSKNVPDIEKQIDLNCSPEHAFHIFTKKISTWWPLSSHSCFENDSDRVVIEERVDGRVIEYSKNGEQQFWGKVVNWNPPLNFSMTWHPSSPEEEATLVSVEFISQTVHSCRVKLTHSKWNNRKDPKKRDNYNHGWDSVLELYRKSALLAASSALMKAKAALEGENESSENEDPVFERTYFLKYEIGKIFKSLTDREALRCWFAKNIEIEAKTGGIYKFWGFSTPWIENEIDTNGSIKEIVFPNKFSFEWKWKGCMQLTHMTLKQVEALTELTITQSSLPKLGYGEFDSGIIKDFWTVSVGNLRSFLRSGNPALVCDFRASPQFVELSIVIDQPVEKVFAFLVSEKGLSACIADKAIVQSIDGGRYSYGWKFGGKEGGPSKIIKIELNKTLIHDWIPSWANDDEQISQVVWEVKAVSNDRCLLKIMHGPFTEKKKNTEYQQGWGSYLQIFKAYLEEEPLVLKGIEYSN